MAIDVLQDKIRRTKNPLAVDMGVMPSQIPAYILEQAGSFPAACRQYCLELLSGLKGVVPAVRFSIPYYAMLGGNGLDILQDLLEYAKKQGYYVFLDGAELLSGQNTELAADRLLAQDSGWKFDGLIVTAYTGSDAIRPYAAKLEESNKDLFVVVRTSNRTAPEIQDLLSGSRLVHMALTEIVNRYSALSGKCGYSRVGVVAAAASADSLRTLRSKFKNLFIFLDGCDYPNANAKNCSYGFDALGHGAIACAGAYITAAWQETNEPTEFVACAVVAAERMKKNLNRYITLL